MSKRVVISGQEWQLVPAEPTPEMIQAAMDAETVSEMWGEILAVAPTPPAQASGQSAADEIEGLRAHVALLKSALAQAERENDELRRAQPAAAWDAETEALRDAQPVAWVAADTLHSPHPTCVSSLAYMSQFDRDRGREYVPLYAAQKADDARDAERYRWLRRGGNDDIGVVRGFDVIEYGSSSVASTYEDSLCGDRLDAVIDAAMQRESGRRG